MSAHNLNEEGLKTTNNFLASTPASFFCPLNVFQVSLKTFDSLTGDLDDEMELAADWFPSAAATANCVMDPSHILCFDSENGLLRHAVLGKQVSKTVAKTK